MLYITCTNINNKICNNVNGKYCFHTISYDAHSMRFYTIILIIYMQYNLVWLIRSLVTLDMKCITMHFNIKY